MKSWRKIKIESYFEQLSSLYEDDNADIAIQPWSIQRALGFEVREADDELNDDDKIFIRDGLDKLAIELSEKMNCSSDRVLLNAFSNPDTTNLALHLLCLPQLGLPASPSKHKKGDSTVFIEVCKKIFENSDFPNAKEVMTRLYAHSVLLNEQDKRYIATLYKAVSGKADEEREWAILRTYMKMNSLEDLKIAFENVNLHTICTITAIKTDSIFGKNLNSMAAYLNHALKSYEENSLLIIKACDLYKAKNKFLKEATTNKKFIEFRKDVLAGNVAQNEEYQQVLLTIFPDLA
ncbi:hypothetical protein [Psychrobacter sp. UBA6291]|uniref:DUF7829 domain-containing protein n=1 Tax=Psychrobacter sp. UBA6291 TaxID=1947357 RepID=UPI00257B2B28|nr:hypothetical protein [Psychrobacter sp. UBA6291]